MIPVQRIFEEAFRGGRTSSLIDTGARKELVLQAKVLPAAMDAAGFECRLAADRSMVDFATQTSTRSEGMRVLGGLADDAPLSVRPEWRRLGELARGWQEGELPWSAVAQIILEFDRDAAVDGVPVPSTFLGLRTSSEDLAGRPRGGWPVSSASAELLERLTGRSEPVSARNLLDEAEQALPLGGAILQVAVMSGRGLAGYRVYAALPQRSLPEYLARLGGPEAARPLSFLWRRYAPGRDWIEIQFDLLEKVGLRWSIELSLSSLPPELRLPTAARILEQMVADGLCEPAKRDAVLEWPCEYPVDGLEGIWGLRQEISHFKIAYVLGGDVEAKAYVYLQPVEAPGMDV